MRKLFLIAASFFIAGGAYADIGIKTPEEKVYTLDRDSILLEGERIHFATFDANDTEQYNKDNCLSTADLIMKLPNLQEKYWCENGYYKR